MNGCSINDDCPSSFFNDYSLHLTVMPAYLSVCYFFLICVFSTEGLDGTTEKGEKNHSLLSFFTCYLSSFPNKPYTTTSPIETANFQKRMSWTDSDTLPTPGDICR